jgi:putative sigma-54 modulation protein
MKLIYSGKTKDFTPELEEKITAKLKKLSKLSERVEQREVHLIHRAERHVHKVEITMNLPDHQLIGEGSDPDLSTSVAQALEKLGKQLLKCQARWRNTNAKEVRSSKESWETEAPVESSAPVKASKASVNGTGRRPKIFHVNYTENRKPMTLEEAMLEMDEQTDYVVYRDSHRNCLSVLVKRPDGNYDLIES